MRLEAKKYLYDIQQAIVLLTQFTAGKMFADYERDAMLRAAVEREFEIIGEALAQLARLDEELAARISEYRRIIAFRNILIHGYAEVDDHLIWDVVETKLPVLKREIESLVDDD
jgi:uncharacterized protein with HEPN domain